MKRTLFSLVFIASSAISVLAQPSLPGGAVYPYIDDFETGYPDFGGTMSGWTQTVLKSFSTYKTHGTGSPASKALTKELNNFAKADSIVSPSIGPLTSTSVLAFDYRIVGYTGGYAATKPMLGNDFYFKVFATILGNDVPLFTINSANHIDSVGFVTKQISAPSQIAGQNVTLKFVVSRGTPPSTAFETFNVDIDNIKVIDAALVNIADVSKAVSNVSIQNDIHNKSIKLFSNKQLADLAIYSIDGKQLYNLKNYISGQSISFDNSGVYILRYNVNGIFESKKIVIE